MKQYNLQHIDIFMSRPSYLVNHYMGHNTQYQLEEDIK